MGWPKLKQNKKQNRDSRKNEESQHPTELLDSKTFGISTNFRCKANSRRVEKTKHLPRSQRSDANFSLTFLGKIREIRRVTNISGSKINKLLSSLT